MCSFGQRCLKTRSGKTVCVQGQKQNYPEGSPQHEVDKEETFVNSPLHDACRKGNLTRAAHRGSKDVFEFLVCMGANVSQVGKKGDKVLHWGCKGGHLGMVKYLLSLSSVDINSSGKMGVTPLMWAALYGYRDIFQFLVRMGASLSQLDVKRNNILHRASLAGRLEMVKYIIRQNTVNINARNKDGETAAMLAKSSNKSRVYNFLVLNGAVQ
ncbi:osteoclast-stimulating factor 1-like [Haliotis rubra]|uniref:osteoclast-stimulating factor 1-like n=1 Tax=Haliotis rubra TaxID=36100 RepID=UPI001EE4EFCF|nr:osteoclast-stimulating factor 1-like [Haliotis rubra]